MEMGWKPNTELSPACPRCGSSNTKFCYYNNYSLTQPRYFCKGCRRYWTKGGSLRNVPVGGGCRKTRRGRSTRAAADAAASRNSSHPNRLHERPITCSSSTASTGIDLAAVYANFLNQPQPPPPPENRAATTLAELPDGIVIPPVEFSGLQMSQLSSYLPQENGFFECGSFLGGGGNNSTFFGGLTTSTTAVAAGGSGFGGMNVLPPLPGEEAAVWPSSEMLLHNQMLPLGQEIIGEEVQPAQQNLSANISPFCGFNNLEAIFRS